MPAKNETIADIYTPPHNLEAEKAVLSSVLIDNEVMYIFEGIDLKAQDFYQHEHQIIFEGMQNLRNRKKKIDLVTLSNELQKENKLDEIGGMDYLYDIHNFIFTAEQAADYAQIVKEKAILRAILKTAQKIIGDVYTQTDDTVEIINKIEKKIFNLTQYKIGDEIRHISELLNQRVEDYMKIVDDPSEIERRLVKSGYKDLDNMINGFKSGDLVILAARPSMGKTAFAINILKNVSINDKKTVAMFSLEMSSASIVDRLISTVAEVPMVKIAKGQLDENDFERIGEAIESLSNCNIYLDDKAAANVPMLRSKLRRLKIEKGKLDLVIIDYLQLMQGMNFIGNRVQEISEISRGLKQLAMELEVPIIALSQLSRAVEQRVDKKPQLSDLRESGAIEQDADLVLMLHRYDYYDPETEKKGITDVFVRKNRNGSTGDIQLLFKADIMKFIHLPDEMRSLLD